MHDAMNSAKLHSNHHLEHLPEGLLDEGALSGWGQVQIGEPRLQYVQILDHLGRDHVLTRLSPWATCHFLPQLFHQSLDFRLLLQLELLDRSDEINHPHLLLKQELVSDECFLKRLDRLHLQCFLLILGLRHTLHFHHALCLYLQLLLEALFRLLKCQFLLYRFALCTDFRFVRLHLFDSFRVLLKLLDGGDELALLKSDVRCGLLGDLHHLLLELLLPSD